MYRKRVQICVFLLIFLGLLSALAVLFYVYPVKCDWCEYLTCIPITDKFCEKYDLNAHLLWTPAFEMSPGRFSGRALTRAGHNISKYWMSMKLDNGAAVPLVTKQEHFSWNNEQYSRISCGHICLTVFNGTADPLWIKAVHEGLQAFD